MDGGRASDGKSSERPRGRDLSPLVLSSRKMAAAPSREHRSGTGEGRRAAGGAALAPGRRRLSGPGLASIGCRGSRGGSATGARTIELGARPRGRGLRAPEAGARARRGGGRAGGPSLSLGEAWGRVQVYCGGAARGREGDVPSGGVTGPGRPSPLTRPAGPAAGRCLLGGWAQTPSYRKPFWVTHDGQ